MKFFLLALALLLILIWFALGAPTKIVHVTPPKEYVEYSTHESIDKGEKERARWDCNDTFPEAVFSGDIYCKKMTCNEKYCSSSGSTQDRVQQLTDGLLYMNKEEFLVKYNDSKFKNTILSWKIL